MDVVAARSASIAEYPDYPQAPRIPAPESPEDPYRWLEDAEAPNTVAWSAAQDELYATHAATWRARDLFKRLMTDYMRVAVTSAVRVRGTAQFYTRQEPGGEHPVLFVRHGDAERMLFDPSGFDPSGLTVLERWEPSLEGSLVAIQISQGGSEDSRLYVLDAASGTAVDGPIDRLRNASLAWVPGGEGFFYVRRLAPELIPGEERYHRRVYFHQVGSAAQSDALVFGDGREKTRFYAVSVTADGRWLTVSSTNGTGPANDLYIADLSSSPVEKPEFQTVQEGLAHRAMLRIPAGTGPQDAVFILTDLDAPRRRVVRTTLSDPGVHTWRTVVPGDEGATVQDIVLVGRAHDESALLLCVKQRHAVAEIAVHDRTSGRFLRDVPLPGEGSVTDVEVDPADGRDVSFQYVDFCTPPGSYRYEAGTGVLVPFAVPQRPISGLIKSEQVVYRAKDGVEVRMFLMYKEQDSRGPRPTILAGYGGFGASMNPGYSPQNLAWVHAGGVYAVACVRGGGEEGADWHRGGRLERKTNTFDDFEAAADFLVEQGWTTPRLLGVMGGSNGGLAIGAALTRFPEKFAAAVCLAPLLDMLRYEYSGMGPSWRCEYGSVENPAEAAVLRSYSPYHHVQEGIAYPAVMFGAFDGDSRVDPLHARKMCAAMQHASRGRGPVLLRVERGVGHGARSASSGIGLSVDCLAFLADSLGIDDVLGVEDVEAAVVR